MGTPGGHHAGSAIRGSVGRGEGGGREEGELKIELVSGVVPAEERQQRGRPTALPQQAGWVTSLNPMPQPLTPCQRGRLGSQSASKQRQ